MEKVKLIECPRDAMQGIHEFIPTDVKVDYLNDLLKVGFDTIDIGSLLAQAFQNGECEFGADRPGKFQKQIARDRCK